MEKKFILSQPKYSTVLLSGKKCTFRPMNIREERSLLLAKQTNDRQSILKTLIDVMDSCFEEKTMNFTLHDFENAFLMLRAKSIGEIENFTLTCPETKEKVSITVNLEKDLIILNEKVSSKIKLFDNLSIKVREPTMKDILKNPNYSNNTEELESLIADCIVEIIENKVSTPREELSSRNIELIIALLSPKQYKEILNYFNSLPIVKIIVKYKTSDTKEREIQLKGIFSFISFFLTT